MKLEEIIRPTQPELFQLLRKRFRKKRKGSGGILYCDESFVLVRGKAPVMLVAHLDTVHAEPVKHICTTDNGNVLMSPQGIGGDDRCGVFALCAIYERAAVKPWLLFTCDEEVGGLGADTFCQLYAEGKMPIELGALKFIVEIDRKGSNDAVYYDCDNPEFEEYVSSKGFVTAHGSFSDISYIAPELGVAAVNLSSGYYNAHTPHEYIVRSELNCTIKRVTEMVADATAKDFPRYEYIERFTQNSALSIAEIILRADRWKDDDWDYDDQLYNWK